MVGAERAKRTMADRFWGRMAGMGLSARVVALLFVLAAVVAMSFCQLGFWHLGIIDEKPVYLLFFLGPLIMGAFIFGPLTGTLLGLYVGAVLFAHAMFFPLDYYELYFMTPLNTLALLTVVGGLSGLVFDVITRRKPQSAARAGLIAGACLVISFATSGMMTVNTIITYGGIENIDTIAKWLINSPLGLTVQALIDAALMTLLCLIADVIIDRHAHRGGNRTLLSIFRNWMILVSAIVFMLASTVAFSVTTLQAQDEASASMYGEVEYILNQINSFEISDYGILLEGYSVDLDGTIVITDQAGTILATDDNRYPVGASLVDLLGYGEELTQFGMSREERAGHLFGSIDESSGLIELQAVDKDGVQTMDVIFMATGAFDDGYVVMLRPPSAVYATRFDTMAALTILAAMLISSIAILAAILLSRVVVRRVDETNATLEKITGGNLDEKVKIRDSREFISLSAGINTTVAALKDTIEEVEQRNAQDLATAKAIQESALPRDFPPFPDIDRFDIYASMKTAKEVGGDFYDFFLIEEGAGAGKLGFVMADVSGKGIPAALFMMTAKTQIRNYMESGIPVNEAVDAANHQLCIGNDAGMFVTAWVGVLDYETGALDYVNAGHNPPMLLHDGAWEWVKEVSGMPLGLFDGIPYDAYTRQLEPGDMLYTYTDGVTEAMDANGALFGEDRLEKTLHAYGSMNPRSVGVGVRRAITDFTLDCEQSDDITMLILKYGVPPEQRALMILPADDKQLVHVNNFIHEELRRRNAPKSVYNPLDIAVEELFVNVCHYAYPDATADNPGEVRIGFEYEANPPSLTVTIADDGIPYDPLAKPDAVTPDNILDVPIGGLGILMTKKSVDNMTYERIGDSNVVTIVKKW